ncbi:MAG: TIGR00300 family protein [Candidatus Abyssobacteria bacterium SURF_17]|jgi:lysine-ketoglutarate reductase/saccharopine dehydrogenase-like protein (TIGR00300 family)|uniref:ornithine cyclodeaminase n=1 Tax=Candidatus Abyssobacteria bacterium SURF_17 TaxID=2093361 RepID=A0A419F692_9BACT|nr:MAG: TIGR00300 family protein [Candidatus Abyssubacteria bacterium SURF_17]
MYSDTVEISGHIIDSLLLPKILDDIVRNGIDFHIEELRVGKKREDPSYARIRLTAKDAATLENVLKRIRHHGAVPVDEQDCASERVEKDGVFPDNFYSTTNQQTFIRCGGRWIEVQQPEMDCGIRVSADCSLAECVPISEARAGDLIVVGHRGVRVAPLERPAKEDVFGFMSSSVSTEKPKGAVVKDVARCFQDVRYRGQKILVVAGPAIVHTGAVPHFVRLIESGYVNVLFAGNALAVHDIEYALYGTSLGVYLDKGIPAEHGHENHMRAINTIRKSGGIKSAVEKGVLTRGIMHACVTHGVPFLLAGSIRDDGPLPEVITDVIRAQQQMRAMIRGVRVALMVATTLHSIAVGNLLPATVKTICVDINPAVVTKLADRGSFQALGIVTDVEPFFRELCEELRLGSG